MKNLENKSKDKLPLSAKLFFSVSEGFFSMIPFKEELGLSDTYNLARKINANYNCTMGRLAGQLVMASTYILLLQSMTECGH